MTVSVLPTAEPCNAHQHALKLAALGLRVLPIKPGRKHPPMGRPNHPSRLLRPVKWPSTLSEPGDATHVPGSDTAAKERCDA